MPAICLSHSKVAITGVLWLIPSICLQVKTGVPPEQALMVLVPEAYRNHPDLVKNYPEVRGPAAAHAC